MNLVQEYYPILFIAIGMFALLYALLEKATKTQLKKTGIQITGTVAKQDYDSTSSASDSAAIKDQIFIRFETLEKELIYGKIDQEFETFYTGQYYDGEEVTVYYEKSNPSNFYVDSKQSELGARLLFAIGGLIFTVIGLYKFIYA